ncbi:MAG: glutaredoxin family protein [Woeseiaceae bacterium]|nr:glutaredoxin family protein [Woeseiaceae bacterium]
MPVFDVYSRRGCHLCDVLLEQLVELVAGRARIDVHDVDSREDWRDAYGRQVPVVEFRGRPVCALSLDRDAVEAALATGA